VKKVNFQVYTNKNVKRAKKNKPAESFVFNPESRVLSLRPTVAGLFAEGARPNRPAAWLIKNNIARAR